MKNSVDNAAPTSKPTPKKVGMIRFEAIIPLAIVIGVIVFYFAFFFDMHLRRGLEYGATLANGAEVNIGQLNTSVLNASVVISDVEMTNPSLPSSNRIQIGTINFHLLWDALLRGKVVINEASITDVQINTPRKLPGRVLPVQQDGLGESYSDKVLGEIKEEFSQNVVGDLAAIAAGANPVGQLNEMGADLKSNTVLAGIHKSLDEKNQQWQSRMAAMPKGEDFADMQRRLSNVKLENLQDITQIQASLKELESLRDDFDVKSKSVQTSGAALTADLGTFRATFSELDKVIKEDVRDLQAHMRLPPLDAAALSRALFGMDVLGKVQQARNYMEQARSYMPVKRDQKSTSDVRERKAGHNYAFARLNGYPRFWLKKALISARSTGGSTLSGEILDVTSSPYMIGRPMMATIKGDLPQQGITGIKAELMIDHTTSMPVERLLMEVGKYSVTDRSLVDSQNVEIKISKAESAVKFMAELREENVDMHLTNQFTQVAIEVKSQSDIAQKMISASVAGLNTVNLNAHVTGVWSELDWQLSSNLGEALERGMRRYLQGEIDAARARIESQVNDRITEQRQNLYVRQGEMESSLKSALTERQVQIDKLRSALDGARSKLEGRKNSLLGVQQQKLKQGSGKLLDDLRKKF